MFISNVFLSDFSRFFPFFLGTFLGSLCELGVGVEDPVSSGKSSINAIVSTLKFTELLEFWSLLSEVDPFSSIFSESWSLSRD